MSFLKTQSDKKLPCCSLIGSNFSFLVVPIIMIYLKIDSSWIQ